ISARIRLRVGWGHVFASNSSLSVSADVWCGRETTIEGYIRDGCQNDNGSGDCHHHDLAAAIWLFRFMWRHVDLRRQSGSGCELERRSDVPRHEGTGTTDMRHPRVRSRM